MSFTLDGSVGTLWDKLQLVEAARQTPGIECVDSLLQIARAETDNQLATAVSRELQNDPRLGIYDYAEAAVRAVRQSCSKETRVNQILSARSGLVDSGAP